MIRSVLPIAGVLLALFAAGCVAYIAWQVLREVEGESRDGDDSSRH